MAWALRKIEKEKPAAGKTDYWRGFWRSGWDSNPRNLAVQLISSAAPSTTRTTLRVYFHPVFFPKICLKIRWGENRRESKKYSILRFSVLRCINGNQGDEIHRSRRNFESCSHLAFPCLLWSVTAALETAKALVLQRILDAPTGIDQLHIRKNLSSN